MRYKMPLTLFHFISIQLTYLLLYEWSMYLDNAMQLENYGGPEVSRQNLLFHGKTYFLTAKHTFSRQNILSHGKTYFFTAKHTFSRQNLLSHGKTYFFTAKHTFSRQNLLSHGKTFFFTSKLCYPEADLVCRQCLTEGINFFRK